MFTVEWGEIMAMKGKYMKIAELRGHTPPICSQKGGKRLTRLPPPTPRCRQPQQCTRKINNVHVLCVGFGRLASRARIEFEEGWVAHAHLPRACFPYPPDWLKKAAVYPPFAATPLCS